MTKILILFNLRQEFTPAFYGKLDAFLKSQKGVRYGLTAFVIETDEPLDKLYNRILETLYDRETLVVFELAGSVVGNVYTYISA
jgi:hypothetical protein